MFYEVGWMYQNTYQELSRPLYDLNWRTDEHFHTTYQGVIKPEDEETKVDVMLVESRHISAQGIELFILEAAGCYYLQNGLIMASNFKLHEKIKAGGGGIVWVIGSYWDGERRRRCHGLESWRM